MASFLTTCRRLICAPRRMAIAVALLLLVAMTGSYFAWRASVTARISTEPASINDELVAQQHDSALLRAERAKLLFEQRKFDEATAELRAAIRLNPGDAGQENRRTSKPELSEDALRHGEEQVKRMLADRPAMARRASPGSFLWNWATRKFAGEDVGMLVEWSPNDPKPLDGNCGGTAQQHPWLQVGKSSSDNPDSRCESEWATTVCQFYRLAANEESRAVAARAIAGKIDRDAFVLELLIIDSRARQLTRSFYLEHYLPLFDLERVSTTPTAWHCFEFYSNEEDRIASWRATPSWIYYTDMFELLSAEFALQRGDYSAASRGISFLESNQARLTSAQLERFHYARARQFEVQNNFMAALKEFQSAAQYSKTSPLAQHLNPSPSISDVRASLVHRAVSANQITVIDLDRLIDQAGDSSFLYAMRARLHFQKNEFDLGSQDLRQAIRFNPGDIGREYEPSTDAKLSAEAMQHGEAQVEAMLRDRPAMTELVTKGDELWTWAVRKFAGEDGELVDWSSASPAPFEARCTPATATQRAQIRVRESTVTFAWDRSEEANRLWAYAVFELHNLTGVGKAASAITRQAWQGTMDRENFITAMLNQEQFAVQAARAFYLNKYLPLMRAKGVNAAPNCWYCFTFYSSDDARTAHWKAISHWDHYGSYFDELMAHRMKASQGQGFKTQDSPQIVTGDDLLRLHYESESRPGGNGPLNQLGPSMDSIDNLLLPEPDSKSAPE